MGVRPRRDHDDRNSRISSDRSAALETIHPRKHQVDEDKVDLLLGEEVEGGLAAGGLADVVALALE